MYLHVETLRKAVATALLGRPFRLKRWTIVLGFTILFLLFWCFLALGRLLDNVFFRGWRRQPVMAPVFIIATPRSGTTFLQRLLSLDTVRFKPLLMYEMIFSAVVWLKMLHGLGRLDRVLGRPGGRIAAFIGRHAFGNWDDRHFMRLDLPEEDETLYIFTLVTETVYLLFPYFQELPPVGIADALPARDADRAVRFFREGVRRILYVNGQGRTVLTKGTSSLGRIRALRRAFPDARFIHLVRHPAEVVPSHVSVFYPTWQVHSPEIAKISPETRAYAELAASWYRHMLAEAPGMPQERYIRVSYEELVADPKATVERIYRQFGFTLDPSFSDRLERAAAAAKQHRSTHRYSLAEYGLDEAWLEKELGEVLAAYGYHARVPEPAC
jgi:omega-hydroxy-beta-dihydromenaquinone-9 sulfotransferase